ncbi:MAG: type VI secretion system baseplate subunit TssG [Planctomycetaceae bacterium]|nr:type VI secretion system baseplate subunit TssG [Planctomycetaceae bacterium]
MASSIGRTSGLDQRLFQHPEYFDFFQITRLLEQRFGREHLPNAVADGSIERDIPTLEKLRLPLGYDAAPDQEVVRFRTTLAAAFPGTEVVSLIDRFESPELPPEMVISFMGLVGPSGVLPDSYTEKLRELALTGETAAHVFFDLFLHRSLSLYYRGWKKHRSGISFEQRRLFGLSCVSTSTLDCFSDCMRHLVGLGQKGVQGNLARQIIDIEKIESQKDPFELRLDSQSIQDVFTYYSSHFATSNRSSVGLEEVLGDVFREQVSVIPFQHSWLYLDPEVQSRFPARNSITGSSLTRLGEDFVLGARVRDQETKFVIQIGPIASRERFLALLPWSNEKHDGSRSNAHNRLLQQITRLYSGPQYEIEINLLIFDRDVSQFAWRLPQRDSPPNEATHRSTDPDRPLPALGWTTILGRSEQRIDEPTRERQGFDDSRFSDVRFSLDFIPSPN